MSETESSRTANVRGNDRPRPFRRSRADRAIAGVCGGLARYFGVDAVLVRVAFVVLTLAGGSGILAYLILWLVVPEETGEEKPLPRDSERHAQLLPILFGGLLIAAGAILLVDQLIPWFDRVVWPIVLIALGVLVLIHRGRG